MQLNIESWNSTTDINNGTDFTAWFEKGSLQAAEREPLYVDRSQIWPKLSQARYTSRDLTFKIRCLGTIHSQRETIKRYFTPEDFTLRNLVVSDTADSSRQWYVKGLTTRVVEETPGVMAVTLGLDEPFWRTVAESTATWSVTATGQTTDITVIGNMKAHPQLLITPTVGKAGDYAYNRWIPLYNKTSNAFNNYPLDVGGIDTAALVAGNKMLSAGQDFRVRIDGREVDRWFADSTDTRKMNTTDTAVWINATLPPKSEGTLTTAIASTDTITAITLEASIDNNALIRTLASANNKCFMIDSEAFTYTGVTVPILRIDGVTQAQKGTSVASHSAAATIRHIPYDAWLVYGSSDASAQTVDDSKKPLISPDSTNTSWIYYNFYDSTSPRSGAWQPSIVKRAAGGTSSWYSATQKTYANPSSVMGMAISVYYTSGVLRGDTAEIAWNMSHPAGITAVTMTTGSKYRYSTSWPATAGLWYVSPSTRLWTQFVNEATPSSAQSWTALASTDYAAFGATYNDIKLMLSGTIQAVANSYAALEYDTITLTLDSANTPNATPNAEAGSYRTNAKITNSTTGEWITIDFNGATNKTLTVDCDAKTITYQDGTNARAALGFSSVRREWLDLNVGSNTLQWDETGVAGVTVGIEWENRNSM